MLTSRNHTLMDRDDRADLPTIMLVRLLRSQGCQHDNAENASSIYIFSPTLNNASRYSANASLCRSPSDSRVGRSASRCTALIDTWQSSAVKYYTSSRHNIYQAVTENTEVRVIYKLQRTVTSNSVVKLSNTQRNLAPGPVPGSTRGPGRTVRTWFEVLWAELSFRRLPDGPQNYNMSHV